MVTILNPLFIQNYKLRKSIELANEVLACLFFPGKTSRKQAQDIFKEPCVDI